LSSLRMFFAYRLMMVIKIKFSAKPYGCNFVNNLDNWNEVVITDGRITEKHQSKDITVESSAKDGKHV